MKNSGIFRKFPLGNKKLLVLISPSIIGTIVFFCIQLPVFNKGLSFRDEGLNFYYSLQILHGYIPFRDFLMVLSPGSYYIQAFLFKFFGEYLIIGRLLYIFWAVVILFLVPKVFPLKSLFSYLSVIALALLYYWPGGFAFYNIEGVALALVSLFLVQRGTKNKSVLVLFLAGLLTGSIIFIKQSLGITIIPALLVILCIYSFSNKQRFRLIFSYGIGVLIAVSSFFGYFAINGAVKQLIYFLFFFSVEVKSHQQKYILSNILLLPIIIVFFIFFLRARKRIKIILSVCALVGGLGVLLFFTHSPDKLTKYLNQPMYITFVMIYLLPLLSLSYLVFHVTKNNKLSFKNLPIKKFITTNGESAILVNSILLIGSYFGIAASGKSLEVPRSLAPIALPLLFQITEYLPKNNYKYFAAGIFLILYVLISANNPFSQNQLVYGVYPLYSQTTQLGLPAGKAIYVSPSENADLMKSISYIKTHVPPHGKILCFPYCAIIYGLADRKNVSFYNFFYPELFQVKDQTTVINELKHSRGTLIVIQKKGEIEKEAEYEDGRLSLLKRYLSQHYSLIYETANFAFYK